MQSPTTLDRRLQRAATRGTGTARPYHALAWGPGEPRIVRRDLVSHSSAPAAVSRAPKSLAFFAHLADPQVVDVQSPGRFEFFETLNRRPDAHPFYPAARPQEALGVHAVEALVRTVNSVRESPDSGVPLSLAISAGDNLDNAQKNELQWFLALMAGGEVDPGSGSAAYQGVQDAAWEDPTYWHPDLAPDRYRELWGFPDYPGLLAEALRPLRAEGLALPWLSCFGNHDGLVLGNSLATSGYRDLVLGGRKAVMLPPGFDAVQHASEFHGSPETFLTGPSRQVVADPRRRIVDRREVVEAILGASGLPAGHGYSRASARAGTAYCVHDLDGGPLPVRFLLLDTTNMDGFFEGSIGRRQLQWLEERLIEVSSNYVDTDGRRVWTASTQHRLVVLTSHHCLDDLVNSHRDARGFEDDQPRVLAAEVEGLLHRFPNVVLWANGHRHANKIWPRPDIRGRTAGFWEVSTGGITDWPCQIRLLEVVAREGDTIEILSTMVDSDVPADPGQAEGLARLVALHRELAANDPFNGLDSYREGRAEDRNVRLLLPAPFAAS